jgi:hypothetical protein
VIKSVPNRKLLVFPTVVISGGDCLLVQLTYFGDRNCRNSRHNTQLGVSRGGVAGQNPGLCDLEERVDVAFDLQETAVR